MHTDIPSIEFYECQVLDCHCTIIYCRQSLDNEKQYSCLRDRVTLLLGVVTEIIFLESGLGLLSLILRTLSRLLLRTQYYSMVKTARRINIS